jgi:hypothetical protein
MVLATVGAVAYYSPIVSSQQDQINSLNNQGTAQLSSLNAQITQLQGEVSDLQNKLSDSYGVSGLEMSTVWLSDVTVNQDVGAGVWYQYTATYAGYITVNIQTSTTSNQYVQVTWTSNGVNYSNKVTVGTMGTAVFPVLPSSNVKVTIGNTNLLNGATATVSITYTY